MDFRPSIHARKSERLKFPLSQKPEKIGCKNVKGEKRNAEDKNRTPKPKYSLHKFKKSPTEKNIL